MFKQELVVKIDCSNGKKVWGSMKMIELCREVHFLTTIISRGWRKRLQLLTQTREEIAGLDLDSGKVFSKCHKVKAFRGMNILTPTVIGDSLFTSSYGGRAVSCSQFQINSRVWR